MSKIKLDRSQRVRATDLYEYMCDDEDILEDVAQDLIYKRDEVRQLKARETFLLEMLDDWEKVACRPCEAGSARRFKNRMKAQQPPPATEDLRGEG